LPAVANAEQVGAAWFTKADHVFQMDDLWPAYGPVVVEALAKLGYCDEVDA
jgi:hypothetical protein